MQRAALALTAAALVVAGCGGNGKDKDTVSGPPPPAPTTIALASPAFRDSTTLPKQFTCNGAGINPPLTWFNVPRRAKELALVVEDPDAPGGTFVHWTAWGMTPQARGLQENVPKAGLQQGKNGFGKDTYGAPCPPKGDKPHRYIFTLYALSQQLDAAQGATAQEVRDAIAKVAIAKGELFSKYGR